MSSDEEDNGGLKENRHYAKALEDREKEQKSAEQDRRASMTAEAEPRTWQGKEIIWRPKWAPEKPIKKVKDKGARISKVVLHFYTFVPHLLRLRLSLRLASTS